MTIKTTVAPGSVNFLADQQLVDDLGLNDPAKLRVFQDWTAAVYRFGFDHGRKAAPRRDVRVGFDPERAK